MREATTPDQEIATDVCVVGAGPAGITIARELVAALLLPAPGAGIGGGLRVTDDVQRERDLLKVVFYLVPRPAAITSDGVRSLTTLREAITDADSSRTSAGIPATQWSVREAWPTSR